MVNYEILRTFVEAARAQSFARAAGRRFVTVSAVSQQMKALETQLGVQLFERLGRRVRLSPAGTDLLTRVQGELERIDMALEEARGATRDVRGNVRLGAPRTFGAFWLRARLPALLARHPELRVDVEFGVPSLLERRLIEGEIELCILGRPASHTGIVTRPLYVETFVAVASPAYLELHGTPRSARDWLLQRYIVFDRDQAMHLPFWRASFGRRTAAPENIACQVASLEAMLALAEAGVGVAVLPSYFVESNRRVRVLAPPPGHHGKQRPARNTLFLAWRSGVPTTARFAALRDVLTDGAHI